jgi:uncharacterized protein YjiS (DUF1127 family)
MDTRMTLPARAGLPTRLVGHTAFLGPTGRCIAAIARELAVRHAIKALLALDDRLLDDMGLSRGQVKHAVRGTQANRRESPN